MDILKTPKRTTEYAACDVIFGLYLVSAIGLWLTGLGGEDLHLISLLIPVISIASFSLIQENKRSKLRERVILIREFFDRFHGLTYIYIISLIFLTAWIISYFHLFSIFDIRTFDAGIYSNIVFNTSKGEPFYSSVLDKNHLGEHFSPIMILFVPLYWVSPDTRWLLLAQAISYCTVPIILYKIAGLYTLEKAKQTSVAFSLAIAWFLYLPMRSAMDFTFHPSSLVAPLILIAFLFMEEKRYMKMWLVLGVIILFKENTPFVICGFGLYLSFHRRRYQQGLFALILGSFLMALLMQIVIPYFEGGEYTKLARVGFFVDPVPKLEYLFKLLLPLLFLPLMVWRRGIIALPAIMQNIVANYEPMYSLNNHYDDLISPLLFVCLPGIIIDKIIPFLKRNNLNIRLICFTILFISLTFLSKPSPLKKVWENPKKEFHSQLKGDLIRLENKFPDKPIYLQHPLFTHVNRKSTYDLNSCKINSFPNESIVAISSDKSLRHWPIKDLDQCLDMLQEGKETKQIPGFQNLLVFKIEHDQ